MNDHFSAIDDRTLRSAVMSASMAMAVTDPHQPDNPIVFTNPAFSLLTGYDAGAILGRNCRFLQGSETDPAAVSAIRQALNAKTDIQIDILNYRQDGSPFTNRLFISPVLNEDGKLIHFFASQLDATHLVRENAIKRRREDILSYLTGELSHRLGSTMDVVQQLVRSTLASASSVVDASEALSARLLALGQVYRRMSNNDWEGEDFESLARQTIAPFRPHFAGLDITGPRLHLGALLSLRMASVMYELSSNATIRARDHLCKVHVDWSVCDDPEARVLHFEWREHGARYLTSGEKTKVHRAISVIMNDPRAQVSLCIGQDGGGYVCHIETPLPTVSERDI